MNINLQHYSTGTVTITLQSEQQFTMLQHRNSGSLLKYVTVMLNNKKSNHSQCKEQLLLLVLNII